MRALVAAVVAAAIGVVVAGCSDHRVDLGGPILAPQPDAEVNDTALEGAVPVVDDSGAADSGAASDSITENDSGAETD